jgi:hypothetical protein
MRWLQTAVIVSVLPAACGVCQATERYRPSLRGTVGAIAVPFVATNRGSEPIACSAALAHWYSLSLGGAAPGESIEATLWLDPQTGEIALLNERQDRMAVESLWCGIAGRAWATRSAVPLPREAGGRPAPIRIACVAEGARLRCR